MHVTAAFLKGDLLTCQRLAQSHAYYIQHNISHLRALACASGVLELVQWFDGIYGDHDAKHVKQHIYHAYTSQNLTMLEYVCQKYKHTFVDVMWTDFFKKYNHNLIMYLNSEMQQQNIQWPADSLHYMANCTYSQITEMHHILYSKYDATLESKSLFDYTVLFYHALVANNSKLCHWLASRIMYCEIIIQYYYDELCKRRASTKWLFQHFNVEYRHKPAVTTWSGRVTACLPSLSLAFPLFMYTDDYISTNIEAIVAAWPRALVHQIFNTRNIKLTDTVLRTLVKKNYVLAMYRLLNQIDAQKYIMLYELAMQYNHTDMALVFMPMLDENYALQIIADSWRINNTTFSTFAEKYHPTSRQSCCNVLYAIDDLNIELTRQLLDDSKYSAPELHAMLQVALYTAQIELVEIIVAKNPDILNHNNVYFNRVFTCNSIFNNLLSGINCTTLQIHACPESNTDEHHQIAKYRTVFSKKILQAPVTWHHNQYTCPYNNNTWHVYTPIENINYHGILAALSAS